MTLKLKTLTVVWISLALLGSIDVQGGRAAEFHCSVEPCRYTLKPHGTVPSKESHQVFLYNSSDGTVSLTLTCNEISGEATSAAKTSSELTVTNISYRGCGESQVSMNSCTYIFAAAGTLATQCPVGKLIELKFGGVLSGCILTIASQAPHAGLKFQTGLKTNKELITVQNLVEGLSATSNGCGLGSGTIKFTTANSFLTGETDPGGTTASLWFE